MLWQWHSRLCTDVVKYDSFSFLIVSNFKRSKSNCQIAVYIFRPFFALCHCIGTLRQIILSENCFSYFAFQTFQTRYRIKKKIDFYRQENGNIFIWFRKFKFNLFSLSLKAMNFTPDTIRTSSTPSWRKALYWR